MARRNRSNAGTDPALNLQKKLQPEASPSQPPEVKLTRIRAPGVDVPALADALCRWYQTQGMEANQAATPNGLMIQSRTRQAWKRALALDAALTVVMRREGADLLVEIGAAKWAGRVATGLGAGLVAGGGVATPVAWAIVGAGAWKQYRLPQQTLAFLRAAAPTHVLGATTSAPVSSPQPLTPGETSAPPPLGSRKQRQAPRPQAEAPTAPAQPVDVATASIDQLAAVPGLDPVSAHLIVQERTHGGGYRSLADVRRVLADRISPHEFRLLESRLTLSRPTARTRDPRDDVRDIG